MRKFGVLTQGKGFSKRIFLLNKEKSPVSGWHEINLFEHPQKYVLPGIIEISRHNIAKYEMALDEEHNPIKQDTRKNHKTGAVELRYYARFPLFNYGIVPQTWENSLETDKKHPYKGDGDPLDLVEIGTHPLSTGSLLDVKILGALCLIDEGRVDWKIIGINHNDLVSKKLNQPFDIEKVYPGKLDAIKQWFEEIKTYDGKPPNQFLGGIEGPEEALAIVKEGNNQWKRIISGEYKEQGFWIK